MGTCPKCNSPNEDLEHFFLLCPAYAAHRKALFDHLERLVPELGNCIQNVSTRSNRKKIVKIILFGCKKNKIDEDIFKKSANYVEETQRFKYFFHLFTL